ncbi:[acyl-carrier-protein] S-malonyltransferase [Clonorchis sinensis]|uniref:[acyl-carrier-protein] S-malonyltransferase n=1 Tax=Clonorchis sinensis TaxID=79923 RepID=G7YAQ9_CLOSI|nr:[acyl-carrier-protein] S-malonyltransferase [Clonorchis sinensis]
MQKACDRIKGAMTSVFLNHDSQLKLAIAAALEHCKAHYKLENPECRIANYLYSDCKVVAGHIQAIEFIEQHAPQFRIRRVKRLPVNGAFHTSLMRSAVEPVSRAVSRVDQLKSPSIPVVSALDILPYTTVESLRRKLSLQLVRPVKWEQTLHALYIRPPDTPFPVTVEPGPGKQLGAMLRMANRKAFAHYRALEV